MPAIAGTARKPAGWSSARHCATRWSYRSNDQTEGAAGAQHVGSRRSVLMTVNTGRHTAAIAASVEDGWSLERLTPPSRLYGANGLRTGADGRIYVAQVAGSQVSAIDVDTG